MNIYLDENLSEYVASALNSLNRGYFPDIAVFSTKEVFGRGSKDEIIIPGIGTEAGVLITKDITIHRTRLQNELCKEHNLGVFFLAMPKGQDKHWEIVKLLINHWEEIVSIAERGRMPFAYRIRSKGKMERL